MPIVPDDKDWTWVLERRCPDCGFDTQAVDRDELADRIAATSDAWRAILERPDVGRRPDESTWSPLEYACHVRDVHRVYAGRVATDARRGRSPLRRTGTRTPPRSRTTTPQQDPATVADELAAAGATLGDLFAGVEGEGWQRTGRRSDGASFTIDSIGRYYLHDIEHHLWDVR